MHSVTDRRTKGRTDDVMMPIADHAVYQCDLLKRTSETADKYNNGIGLSWKVNGLTYCYFVNLHRYLQLGMLFGEGGNIGKQFANVTGCGYSSWAGVN